MKTTSTRQQYCSRPHYGPCPVCGKLTEIKLENNEIIDVYPVFTLMNEKNMLYVHPLKEGKTGFSILKNGKDRYTFSVTVDSERTVIKGSDCFDI